jgi:hypothetical protein
MAYRLTIEVPDAKLNAMLKRLADQKVMVENTDPELAFNQFATVPKEKTVRRNGNSLLTMTGKTPQKNSQLAKALDVFEKLEKRVGIGTVTKKGFKDELAKKKLSKQLAVRCITEKVVTYL